MIIFAPQDTDALTTFPTSEGKNSREKSGKSFQTTPKSPQNPPKSGIMLAGCTMS